MKLFTFMASRWKQASCLYLLFMFYEALNANEGQLFMITPNARLVTSCQPSLTTAVKIVSSQFECGQWCLRLGKPSCRSFNLEKLNTAKQGLTCELLSVDGHQRRDLVQGSNDFDHFHPMDACSSNPCQNGGLCTAKDGGADYACTCANHVTGRNCETNMNCSPNPCQNGGNCILTDGGSKYACTCTNHATGRNCEINMNCSPNPCQNGGNCTLTDGGRNYTCTCANHMTGRNCEIYMCSPNFCPKGDNCTIKDEEANLTQTYKGKYCVILKNCDDFKKVGFNQSGLYIIDPDGKGKFLVYCDQNTTGGGWTVFQKRQDGSVDFYLNWTDYKNGFGDLKGEFWLGLDKIHRLTKETRNRLRVELEDFDGNTTFAEYDYFAVDNEQDKYKLSLGNYSGTAGDGLSYHRGMLFTTKDRDNDKWSGGNCAVLRKGAWWHIACHYSNLNGLYHHGRHDSYSDGVNWKPWKGSHYSAKRAEMKIRPA